MDPRQNDHDAESQAASPPPTRSDAPGARQSGDDILQALDEFSTGLANLKVLYAQRQELRERLEAREAELSQRDQQLAEQQAALDGAQNSLAGRVADLARSEAELRVHRDELAASREEVAQLRREAESRAAELRQAEEAAAARAAEFQRVEQALSARETTLTSALDERERNAAQLDAQLREKSAQFEQASREHERLMRDAREKSIRATQELAARAQELEAQNAALAEGEAKVAQDRQAVERAARAFAEKSAELAKREEDLARRVRELGNDQTQAQAQASQAQERSAVLERRVELARELIDEYQLLWLHELKAGSEDRGDVAAAEHVIAQLRDHLAAQLRASEALRAELNGSREACAQRDATIASLEAGQQQARDDAASNADTDLLVAEARAQAAALRERLAQAHAALEAAQVATPGQSLSGDSLARRRRRLKTAHGLLREQTVKIRKASEVLRKRFESCESLLSQRAELAGIRDRVVEAERRAQRARAGSRAATTALCSVVVLGLLGGMSWALAVQFAPATFEATATLEADGRGRELTGEELEEWNRFHFDLLKDPRFHAEAAEKFKRQGMTEFATAPGVARLAQDGILADSDQPGELLLIRRAQGATKAERELEVFAATIQSYANDAQTRRIDGGVTVVSQPAKAGTSPIDQTRSLWALAIMGVATLVTVGFSSILWSRLARAKTEFERDETVTMTLEESRWPNPMK